MIMLKYTTIYAITWSIVLILYLFGWSGINQPLSFDMYFFLISSILISILMSFVSRPTFARRLIIKKQHKPLITKIILVCFLLDWIYIGQVPLFGSYQGFSGEVDTGFSVGIPVVHVILMSFSLYYAMLLSYLYLSNRELKVYQKEYVCILLLFLLNNSRGYIVFCILTYLLLYYSLEKRSWRQVKLSVLFVMIFGLISALLFISFMGNVRSGLNWNDCSMIERIGQFDNYPAGLTKHFMWSYSYITSPLANLNLNLQLNNGEINIVGIISSLIPESFSKGYLSTVVALKYVANYLNAATMYSSFASLGGVFGLCAAFILYNIYYNIILKLLQKDGLLMTFGTAIFGFCAITTIFFNPFTTSAICYFPLYLLITSKLFYKQYERGEVSLSAID
jgi:hypothetical protein